jgi:hypothetical protein
MSESRCGRVFRALAATAILLSAVGAEAQVRQPGGTGEKGSPFTIQLKSRTFTPAPGVERLLVDESRVGGRRTVGLIQLEEAPDDLLRSQLERAGVELLEYVPNNTWMARLPADLNRAAGISGVRWIGRLLPEDKLDAELARPVGAQDKARLTLDVEAFSGSLAEAVARIKALGGTVLEQDEVASTLRVELARGAARELAQSDAIQWIAPEPPRTLFNNRSRINTRANAVQATPYGLSGSGVDLGIWDGGEVDSHTDFGSRLTLVETSAADGHATHVAGTMAGDGALSASFSFPPLHFRGYSTAADIFSYDFNGTPPSEHNGAINTHGIDNSQNSWGFAIDQALYNNCALFGNYPAYSREYDRIVTGLYTRRIPVVFAAGNDRSDGDCGMSSVAPFLNYGVIAPPSTAKNVISVGAINGDDSAMTDFSNWGPTDDGRIKPDLVAPGDNALANPMALIVSTYLSNGYAGTAGTSMAAPAVSGTIGLLLERYRAVCPGSPADPLPSTLKALLIHTARDLDDSSTFFNPGPDYASGYGAMDTKEAVDMVPFHREDQVSTGQTDTYQITVTQQSDLKVTLVWDDVAAAANAAVTLVNNLDLELVDPNSVVYRPWVLNPGSPANNATTGIDSSNVVEQVVVPAVTSANAGVWTIRVIGTNVPTGPQSYSLVTSHLRNADMSCTGAPATDAWIMDKETPMTPVDTGAEPNPDTTPMWISNQIWVRNAADDLLPHENPDFGQTNYVYARIRNDGANTLNTVRVKLYYANASAGLGWPQDWHLIGESTVVNLGAGQATIIDELPWDPPGTGHYCLYARLITDQDPITFTETSDINLNTKNNDEIAWRNVNVADILPNSEGGFEVLFANTISGTAQLALNFDALRGRSGRTLLDVARVQVTLSDDLGAYLREGGITLTGEGVERVDDLTYRIVSPTAFFTPITVPNRRSFKLHVNIQRGAAIAGDEQYILDFNQNFMPLSGAKPKSPQIPSSFPKDDPNRGGVRYEVRTPAK